MIFKKLYVGNFNGKNGKQITKKMEIIQYEHDYK